MYFQILAKDPGWMNRLQAPKAYVPPLPARQPAPQHVPQAQPPPMPRPCAFCNASNCLGQGPRECPIGQDYVRSGRVIFNEGCYRWPNGVRVQGHPQGLKVSVDLALRSQAPSQNVCEGTAAFYRVDSVDGVADWGEERGEVIREVVEGVEEPREVYLAIVSAAAEAGKPHTELNKRSPQYQYSSKCDDPSAVQRVFEQTLAAPANISVGELLSLSPDYWKFSVDFCKVNRTAAYSLSLQLPPSLPTATSLLSTVNSSGLLHTDYGAES
jgi:hypothetical protein